MNGHIGIISEEGKGAIFHFDCEFGVSKISVTVLEEKDLIPSEICVKKLKILLAEDNVINQKVATLNLEKMGHLVSVAADGSKAVEMFKNEVFDAIFMDIQMPEMDGVEATTIIREWEENNNVVNRIPIVAMTANTLRSEKEIFMSVGMDDYLGKPFNSAELVRVIERIHQQLERRNI